eukprot:5946368-Pyramimonas_sp.AAC.1
MIRKRRQELDTKQRCQDRKRIRHDQEAAPGARDEDERSQRAKSTGARMQRRRSIPETPESPERPDQDRRLCDPMGRLVPRGSSRGEETSEGSCTPHANIGKSAADTPPKTLARDCMNQLEARIRSLPAGAGTKDQVNYGLNAISEMKGIGKGKGKGKDD